MPLELFPPPGGPLVPSGALTVLQNHCSGPVERPLLPLLKAVCRATSAARIFKGN